MPEYEAVIGLEVHVHLATASKLFCSCPNSFGDEPNTNVCEVCAGMPGVLPVLNAKAVEYACRMALAVHAEINRRSQFARKNYFYPDMPKGYQISQYDRPLCERGHVDITVNGKTRRIGVTRIHLEDDAGKNIHPQGENTSYVDLNRAGTPLIEIVSDPDLRSAEEAVAYLKTLHGMVVSLGISNGNMEEGSFRCDANVSVRPRGSDTLGTRTELKNLNSFRHVQKAIEYEIARQCDVLDDGEQVVQETRLYDSARNITQAMRGKEDAQDYRYFPDPDLAACGDCGRGPRDLESHPAGTARRPSDPLSRGVEVARSGCRVAGRRSPSGPAVRGRGPAVPRSAQNRQPHAGPAAARTQPARSGPGESALAARSPGRTGPHRGPGPDQRKNSGDIFPELMDGETMPEALVRERGLVQVSDGDAIEAAVTKVLAANPSEVEAYRGGKTKLISFFVGQVMREMRGKANPAVVNETLARHLER